MTKNGNIKNTQMNRVDISFEIENGCLRYATVEFNDTEMNDMEAMKALSIALLKGLLRHENDTLEEAKNIINPSDNLFT